MGVGSVVAWSCSALMARAMGPSHFGADFFALFLILGVDNRSETWYDITCRQATWCHGSVGRAHRSHRWGRRFESYWHHHSQPEWAGFFVVCTSFTSMGRRTERRQWRMKRGETLPDRAQRDRRFESYWHHHPITQILIQCLRDSFYFSGQK